MYQKMKLFVASIFFIAISNLIHATTDTAANRILNDLQKKISTAKGIQASFTLNQKDKNGKTTGIQKGNAAIKGNKYYVKAGSYEIFCNGTKVYHFDGGPEVLSTKISEAVEEPFSPKNIISGQFLKDFSGAVTSNSASQYVLLQTPNDKRKSIKSATITIDKKKNVITKAILTDKVGNTTEVIISSVNLNAELADSIFEFDLKKHPGVREVQQ